MKPSKLARDFHSKRNNLKDKPLEYFERLRSNINDQKKTNENDDNHRKIFSTCILPNFPTNS